MPTVQRLLRASIVALVTFAVAGGGIGFAIAADGQADPDTLAVPAPRPGDRAAFTGHAVILDEEAALEMYSKVIRATYEWMAPRLATDDAFATRLVAPLRYEFVFNAGSQYESHYVRETDFDPLTWEPVAYSEEGSYTTRSWGLLGSTPAEHDYRLETFEGQLAPCGHGTPLHGRPYEGGPVTVRGFCDWPGGNDVVTFDGTGWEEGPRGRAHAFAAREDERVRIWMDSQAPFPVRALVPLGETIYAPYTVGRIWDLQRISFTSGAGSYPAGLETPIPSLGPVEVAPRTAWGVDDAQVKVPFPLHEAYQALLDDQGNGAMVERATGQSPTLRAYQAAHPEAYLAFAWSVEAIDRQGNPHHHWYLAFSDGKGELDKVVARSPRGAAGIHLPQAGEETRVYDWQRDPESSNSGGRFPPAALVPANLPRIQPLMERYEQLQGAGEPNRYGFSIVCSEACAQAEVYVGAAQGYETLWDATSSLAPGLQDQQAAYDQVVVDADGFLRHRYTGTYHRDGALPGTLPPPSAPDGVPATAAALWMPPPAPAAAGLGLVALLAGALYYFWPTLKGLAVKGALGLPLATGFSRIEADRVLDHPQRTRIMDLVAAEPGVHFQELARRLGLGRGSLEHHLRKLESAELVVRRRGQGYVCIFLRNGTDRAVLASGAPLRSAGGRAVFDAVASRPNSSFRAIAADAGLAPSTVEHHLRRLSEAGLVQQVKGQGVRLTATGEAVRNRPGAVQG